MSNKITGKERKRLKKELSKLQMLIKMYWHHVDIEKAHGINRSKESQQQVLEDWKQEAKDLEHKLNEKSDLNYGGVRQ